MIVDPTDPTQGITPSGKPAAQVYFLPVGTQPARDLSNATFVGLTDLDEARAAEPPADPRKPLFFEGRCLSHGESECGWCQ